MQKLFIYIDKTTHFFFDMCNNNTGTYAKLDMVIEKLRNNKDVKLYLIHSYFRSHSNSRKGFHSTIGFNSFVTAVADKHNSKIYTSFEDAFN